MDVLDFDSKCLICDRPAKGIYYKVLACAGCRTFYERTIRKNPVYLCKGKGDGRCDNTGIQYQNSWCRACRFQKWETLVAEALGDKPILHAQSGPADRRKMYNQRRKKKLEHDTGNADPDSGGSSQVDVHVEPGVQHVRDETDLTEMPETSIVPRTNDPTVTEVFADERPVPGSENQSTEDAMLWFTDDWSSSPPVGDQELLIARVKDQITFNPFHTVGGQPGDVMARTYYSVGVAMEAIFGDELGEWAKCMAQALKSQEIPNQPETELNSMLTALRNHYAENAFRTIKFKQLLPGFAHLNADTKRCSTSQWKSFFCAMVHHAPFMTTDETYFAVGPRRLRCCRYWLQNVELIRWTFQVERYLLIASILLEPEADMSPNIPLSILHRHYTSVLVSTIERRCRTADEYLNVCRKLQSFFDVLSSSTQFFKLNRDLPGSLCPPIYVGAMIEVYRLMHTDL